MAADLKIFFYDLGKYNEKKINEISVTLFVISERKCINHIRTGKNNKKSNEICYRFHKSINTTNNTLFIGS